MKDRGIKKVVSIVLLFLFTLYSPYTGAQGYTDDYSVNTDTNAPIDSSYKQQAAFQEQQNDEFNSIGKKSHYVAGHGVFPENRFIAVAYIGKCCEEGTCSNLDKITLKYVVTHEVVPEIKASAIMYYGLADNSVEGLNLLMNKATNKKEELVVRNAAVKGIVVSKNPNSTLALIKLNRYYINRKRLRPLSKNIFPKWKSYNDNEKIQCSILDELASKVTKNQDRKALKYLLSCMKDPLTFKPESIYDMSFSKHNWELDAISKVKSTLLLGYMAVDVYGQLPIIEGGVMNVEERESFKKMVKKDVFKFSVEKHLNKIAGPSAWPPHVYDTAFGLLKGLLGKKAVWDADGNIKYLIGDKDSKDYLIDFRLAQAKNKEGTKKMMIFIASWLAFDIGFFFALPRAMMILGRMGKWARAVVPFADDIGKAAGKYKDANKVKKVKKAAEAVKDEKKSAKWIAEAKKGMHNDTPSGLRYYDEVIQKSKKVNLGGEGKSWLTNDPVAVFNTEHGAVTEFGQIVGNKVKNIPQYIIDNKKLTFVQDAIDIGTSNSKIKYVDDLFGKLEKAGVKPGTTFLDEVVESVEKTYVTGGSVKIPSTGKSAVYNKTITKIQKLEDVIPGKSKINLAKEEIEKSVLNIVSDSKTYTYKSIPAFKPKEINNLTFVRDAIRRAEKGNFESIESVNDFFKLLDEIGIKRGMETYKSSIKALENAYRIRGTTLIASAKEAPDYIKIIARFHRMVKNSTTLSTTQIEIAKGRLKKIVSEILKNNPMKYTNIPWSIIKNKKLTFIGNAIEAAEKGNPASLGYIDELLRKLKEVGIKPGVKGYDEIVKSIEDAYKAKGQIPIPFSERSVKIPYMGTYRKYEKAMSNIENILGKNNIAGKNEIKKLLSKVVKGTEESKQYYRWKKMTESNLRKFVKNGSKIKGAGKATKPYSVTSAQYRYIQEQFRRCQEVKGKKDFRLKLELIAAGVAIRVASTLGGYATELGDREWEWGSVGSDILPAVVKQVLVTSAAVNEKFGLAVLFGSLSEVGSAGLYYYHTDAAKREYGSTDPLDAVPFSSLFSGISKDKYGGPNAFGATTVRLSSGVGWSVIAAKLKVSIYKFVKGLSCVIPGAEFFIDKDLTGRVIKAARIVIPLATEGIYSYITSNVFYRIRKESYHVAGYYTDEEQEIAAEEYGKEYFAAEEEISGFLENANDIINDGTWGVIELGEEEE